MAKQVCTHFKIPEQCPTCARNRGKGGALPSSPQIKNQIHQLHHKILEIIQKDPKKAAKILADWANKPANKPAKKPIKKSA